MKSFIRIPMMISLLASAMVIPLKDAAAQTVFMVQLGSFKTTDEAKAQWDKLTSTFPDLFQPLSYAPTEVMLPPDDFVYHRTQAGPIATREEADGICDRVVSGGFECYVVETAMFTAPYNEADAQALSAEAAAPVAEENSTFFDSAAEDAQPASEPQKVLEQALAEPTPAPAPAPEPVAAAPAPVAEAAPEPVQLAQAAPSAPEPAPIPAPAPAPAPMPLVQAAPSAPAPTGSPFGSGPSVSETAASAPVAVAAPAPMATSDRGNVRVAEAIPVPVSTPQPRPASSGGFRGTPGSYNRNMALWAEIGYFNSQGSALGYWNTLRQRDRTIPGGLRLRVTQPFTQKHLRQKMSLRVGPFSNVNAIRRLCSFTRPEKLGCRAVRDLGGSISAQPSSMGAAASGTSGYATRRAMRNGSFNGRPSPFRAATAPARGGAMDSMFWIQLGAFMAPQAALDKWSELQLLHKKELGSLNEQVYAPAGNRSLFRLRAGPFARAAEAIATCEALKRKGTLCVVVSER